MVFQNRATTEPTDRELLRRYAAGRDEAAFAALVRRHGGLVSAVCGRILKHGHDAEDAFQAVFCVLARRSGEAGWSDSVGPWLFRVAERIARSARGRRKLWASASDLPERASRPGSVAGPLDDLIDAELARLPERYRAPLVLCHMQNRSRDEAARELGLSEGALRGRLARALAMLQARLTRRGLPATPAVILSTLAAPNDSGAAEVTLPFSEANPAMFAMLKSWLAPLAALIVLAAGGYGLWVSLADPEPPPGSRPQDVNRLVQPAGVRGTVKRFDAAKSPPELTILLNGDKRVALRLDAAAKVEVFVGGRPASASDVKEGSEAVAVLAADQRTVARIEIEGRQEEGRVGKVDAAAGTLELKDDEEAKLFSVGPDATVVIDGYKSTVADLDGCTEASVEFAADNKTVGLVRATWRTQGDLRGGLTAVDAEQKTVTVHPPAPGSKPVTLSVPAGAKIYLNGRPATLADLKPGFRAEVRDRGRAGESVEVLRAVQSDGKDDDDDD